MRIFTDVVGEGSRSVAAEYKGKEELEDAWRAFRELPLALYEWPIQILATGFQDEDLIKMVVEVMEDCWNLAAHGMCLRRLHNN